MGWRGHTGEKQDKDLARSAWRGGFGPLPAFWIAGGSLEMLFLILLFVLLLAVLPTWPYSAGWGFYPSGGLGVVLLIVLVLVLMGRI